MKLKFDYYLHDHYTDAEHEEYAEDLIIEHGCKIPLADLYDFFALRPFYELTVHVEYDTETREFEIVGCS